MKSFIFLKLNCIAKVNLTTGIRNLQPHQDCMLNFPDAFDADIADGMQVHLRSYTCQSALECLYRVRPPSVQHYHAPTHHDHRPFMPTPHSKTTDRQDQLRRLNTQCRHHRVIPTTVFLLWSLLHRSVLDTECSYCVQTVLAKRKKE